jgi:chromosome segregation ATPase
MAQATDTDIQELKMAIDGIAKATDANTKAIDANTKAIEANAKAIDTIAKATEANTKAIEANAKAIDTNTKAIEALVKATEANAKAIVDLTLEMKIGFAKVEGKIDTLDMKVEERTKGFGVRLDGKELAQRSIFTGSAVVVGGGILLALAKFLFFGSQS